MTTPLETTVPVIAGALVRRAFRRRLDFEGIPYTEDRGMLDSQFLVTVTPLQMAKMRIWAGANQ